MTSRRRIYSRSLSYGDAITATSDDGSSARCACYLIPLRLVYRVLAKARHDVLGQDDEVVVCIQHTQPGVRPHLNHPSQPVAAEERRRGSLPARHCRPAPRGLAPERRVGLQPRAQPQVDSSTADWKPGAGGEGGGSVGATTLLHQRSTPASRRADRNA